MFQVRTGVKFVLIIFLNVSVWPLKAGDDGQNQVVNEQTESMDWEQQQGQLQEQLHIALEECEEKHALDCIADGAPLFMLDWYGKLPTDKAATKGLNMVLYVLIRLNAPFSADKLLDNELLRSVKHVDWQKAYDVVYAKRFKVAQKVFFTGKPHVYSDLCIVHKN